MKRLIALVLAGQMAISGAFAQPVLAEEPATEDASAIQIEDEGADEKATEKLTTPRGKPAGVPMMAFYQHPYTSRALG